MHETGSVELKRDCEATRIPSGEPILLTAGTPVDITQTLGGSFTVRTDGGLFRIQGQDADALGLSGATLAAAPINSEPADENAVWNVLRSCYDPEIPVNIVDLGLVYDLQLNSLPAGGKRVAVKMTLTAPGCGMGGVIASDAQQKILDLPGIEEAEVEIVWAPPWNPARISPEGRARLGMD